MPPRPSPLPDALAARIFTLGDARASGVSAQRLRRSDVLRIGPSLYRPRLVEPTEADVIAAYCGADPRIAACGPSAARLWGLPLPRALETWAPGDPVHLTTSSSRRRSGPMVIWHDLALGPGDVRSGERVRATGPARTFLDMAALLDHDSLVIIGDALVRRPRPRLEGRSDPWTTLDELRAAAGAFRGRGARRAREALRDVRMSADSPPETRLRLACIRDGLPEPVANGAVVVGGVDLGEPDLHWPQWRVCGEHEGPRHRTPEQQARDIRRTERRARFGWVEVLTTSGDLRDQCRTAVRRYTEALLRQGWRP